MSSAPAPSSAGQRVAEGLAAPPSPTQVLRAVGVPDPPLTSLGLACC